METRASKRKKLVEEENKRNEKSIDKISHLPDDILHHILSLLPFKSAAQTSLLSRRWSQVWASYPVLEFSCPPWANFLPKNVDFINRVLTRRHENSYIKHFKVEGRLAASSLHGCISGLVKRHRVEILVLHVSLCDKFDLPRCVYECDSLKSLALNAHNPTYSQPRCRKDWFGFSSAYVKDTSGLGSLHTLSLIRVNFSGSSFSFPSLKMLTVGLCKEMNHLNITCPALKDVQLFKMTVHHLVISGMRLEKLELKYVRNKDFSESSLNIVAPNLKTFWWDSCEIYEKCLIQSFPALRTSGIFPRFWWWFIRMKQTHGAVNLLSGSSHVEELWLSSEYPKILSTLYFQGGLQYSFTKLKTLAICAHLDRSDIPGIACIFKSSPNVHKLTVEIYGRNETNRWDNDLLDNSHCTEEQYWKTQAQPLSPFLCHLEVVKIYVSSEMHEGVVDFARFLLEHGRALQEIILDTLANTESRSLWEDKLGFLEGLPRAHIDVKILVV